MMGYISYKREILLYIIYVLIKMDNNKRIFKDIYCNNVNI